MTGHEFKLKGSVSNEGTNMKIIDVQVLQLAGPELPKVMKPAWAPGSQWRRWGGTIVKVFTDEGITVRLNATCISVSGTQLTLRPLVSEALSPCAGDT